MQAFQHHNPSIAKEFPTSTVCLVHATFLPYNGGITYMSTMGEPSARHYNTPKELADAVRTAIQVSKDAFDDTKTKTTSTHRNDSDGNIIALYRCLNIDTDYHICRRAIDRSMIPAEMKFLNAQGEISPHEVTSDYYDVPKIKTTGTLIHVKQVFWKPSNKQNDPQMESILRRVVDGPKPFSLEVR